MPAIRTSQSHPLQIATIAVPGCQGKVGVTFCPGKRQASALTGSWDRDLPTDITAIKQWGAAVLVCLMEQHELTELGVDDLPAVANAAGIKYIHLAIRDGDVPNGDFEKQWKSHGKVIRDVLQTGGHVVIHCKGGLGRSGTIAARLLVELGLAPRKAINLVRKHRQGAIETKAQESHVLNFKPGASESNVLDP